MPLCAGNMFSRNIWVIEFGLIASALVIPYAFVAGYYRGIPVGWRLIDCSFGVVGFALLWFCYHQLKYIFSSLKSKQYHESI
jgi:Na+/melibiose symporter-like transporter